MMPWWQLKEEYLKPIGGFLLLPYVLYKEIKEQIDLWKTKGHTPFAGKGGEVKDLKALGDQLGRYRKDAGVSAPVVSHSSLVDSLRLVKSISGVVEGAAEPVQPPDD